MNNLKEELDLQSVDGIENKIDVFLELLAEQRTEGLMFTQKAINIFHEYLDSFDVEDIIENDGLDYSSVYEYTYFDYARDLLDYIEDLDDFDVRDEVLNYECDDLWTVYSQKLENEVLDIILKFNEMVLNHK